MRVHLVRRWGQRQAGRTVDVDAVQGRWLLDHGFAQPAKAEAQAASGSRKPESNGSDASTDGGSGVSASEAGKGARRGRSAGVRKASGSDGAGAREAAAGVGLDSGPAPA